MRGGAREGAGRKLGSNNRSVRWPIRWTEEEQQEIESAAVALGKPPSEIIRAGTLEKIRMELSKIVAPEQGASFPVVLVKKSQNKT